MGPAGPRYSNSFDGDYEIKKLNNPWLIESLRTTALTFKNKLTKVRTYGVFGEIQHGFMRPCEYRRGMSLNPPIQTQYGNEAKIACYSDALIDVNQAIGAITNVDEAIAKFSYLHVKDYEFGKNRKRYERVPKSLYEFIN